MFLNELFIEILKMSLTASVIALVIIILRKTMKPVIPKGMFICLWAVFILKLLLPIEIPSPTSLYNKVDINEFAIISELDDTEAQAEAVQDENAQRQETLSYSQVANEDEAQNMSAALSVKTILSVIYLCLFALITGVFFIMYLKTYYKIKRAALLDDLTALRIVNEYEIKRSIRLRKLPEIKSPMVFGVFRPVIILPEDYDFSSENELRHLLAHEIQHIKNFDNLWNYLMLLSLCVHFFNPLVWVCRRLFTRDMEIACDGRVLSGLSTDDRRNYAETILSIAGKGAKKAPVLAMGFNKIDLKERLKSVARFKKSTKLAMSISGVVVISVILIFATGIFNAGVNEIQNHDDTLQEEDTDPTIVYVKANKSGTSQYEQSESSSAKDEASQKSETISSRSSTSSRASKSDNSKSSGTSRKSSVSSSSSVDSLNANPRTALSDERLEEIKEALYEFRFASYPDIEFDDILITAHYGTYNNATVFGYKLLGYEEPITIKLPVERPEPITYYVAGYPFRYFKSSLVREILVYKDSMTYWNSSGEYTTKFLPLEAAYEAGVLTESNIRMIHGCYRYR